MNFSELAEKRYSVRSFRPDKVNEDAVGRIIRAGYVAPTACNRQPFRIIAVQSEEGLERFRRCTECHFGAPLAFIVCCDRTLQWTRPYDGRQSGEIDAAIVATHMMLEAADLGVGSTWVMYFMPEAVRTGFELPDNLEPVVLLPMGYPADNAAPAVSHTQYRDYGDVVCFR